MMKLQYYIQELRRNKEIFTQIFSSIDEELRHWKKQEENWSNLEVLCHLLDEEREDFRLRLQSLWNDPEADFIPIDPANWPSLRKYSEQDFDHTLAGFLEERDNSIAFLEELDEEDARWKNIKHHEQLGELSPEFYLHNWLAHDLLHIRQLTRIRYDYVSAMSLLSVDYAGTWK